MEKQAIIEAKQEVLARKQNGEVMSMVENNKQQLAKAMATTIKAQPVVAAVTHAAAPAVVHSAPPSVLSAESKGWGAAESLDASDLTVPKIYHMQATSAAVKGSGNVRAGDFVDSITGEVLATKDAGLEVVIFGSYKTMIVSKLNPKSQKFDFVRTVPINKQNAMEYAAKKYIEEVGGETIKYNLTYNYYCLVPSRMTDLPYVLSLGSTKGKVAKRLNAMLYRISLKKSTASVVFRFTNIIEKNDKGDWFGFDVSQGRDVTKEELETAFEWFKKSQSQTFVVADSESETPPEHVVTDSGIDSIPF